MINLLLGDYRFFWPENIKFFSHIPFAWDASLNTGVGISQVNTLSITSYLNFTSFFTFLGLSWTTITIVFWVIPIITISFLSSFFLFRTCINKNNLLAVLAGIIFTTNTYFLSIFFGGQMGVSFGYVFIPLVFLTFISLFRQKNLYSSVLFGFPLSFQVLFDPRIASLTVASLLLYYVFRLQFSKKDLLYLVAIPLAIVLLLHVYWILPLLFYKSTIIPQGFNSLSGVKFLSFAFLENTLSFLHPNWPENIFGKVYFMRPEFLLIPVVAFTGLLFLKKEETERRKIILFFSLLTLLSAFLAKGANEPFGGVFLWLINKVPGFSIFRDSTKFYVLIALSYSVLIPFSLWKISEQVSYIKKFSIFNFQFSIKSKIFNLKNISSLILIFFLLFWLFSLRLLFYTHTILKVHQVPKSYVQLKDFIVSQNHFFRTLWIPQWQRYGYFSDINPAIGRHELFKEASASGMVKELKEEKTLETLQHLSVKYVIVPEDSEGEFFLDDRKYSEEIYRKTVEDLEKIAWLKRAKTFGKIVVFEVSSPRDRFWSPSTSLRINSSFIDPTLYKISVKGAKKGDVLVFSEGFDPNWTVKTVSGIKYKVLSIKYNKQLNSFILPIDGNYKLEVFYQPQKLVNIGLIISGITFAMIILYLSKNVFSKKSRYILFQKR